jgi:hypothetical protein
VRLPYDIKNPPAAPPAGCDPLLWQVAYALRAEHEAGPDGWCVAGTCHGRSVLAPCERRELADAALMGSIGGRGLTFDAAETQIHPPAGNSGPN